MIISFMDTFTSMLAGVTVFSILGNLALESGKQVSDVATSGSGLAFISYPEAIGKFPVVPHVRATFIYFLFIFVHTIDSTYLRRLCRHLLCCSS